VLRLKKQLRIKTYNTAEPDGSTQTYGINGWVVIRKNKQDVKGAAE
jgi:hypothetical protein